MSAPVNVLSVLDAEIQAFTNTKDIVSVSVPARKSTYEEHLARLREARAAVAELIEADREYDVAAEAYKALHAGTLHVEFVEVRDRMRDATLRREAALARVGGAK
jgi:hypothetical protein